MFGLPQTLKAIPSGSTRRVYGTAYWDGSKWFANIGGNLLDARWMDPIQPMQGGKIIVDITSEGRGLGSALVIGGYTDQPRPSTGTVMTVGTTEIVFAGDDGNVYSTQRFVGTYAPTDLIYITWDAAIPTILGIIPSINEQRQVEAPGGFSGTVSGETTLVAAATDTWGVGGWGRWATSQNGGEDVYSGTQSGFTVTGSWFYGPPRPELAGKTITRVQFKVPARLPGVGAYNSPVTVHLYAHTSQARPGGDVTRVVGPHDVGLAAASLGGVIDLPLSFAPVLAAGGGISIAGEPYVGFQSRLDDPQAGKIIMNWSS